MVNGASYTDVNAQLPALTFLTIVAVICAVLFFVNARYRVWSLPIIAVGLWSFVSVIIGGIYPTVIQKISVEPNELQKESKYIDRNIAGQNSRQAKGRRKRLERMPRLSPPVQDEDSMALRFDAGQRGGQRAHSCRRLVRFAIVTAVGGGGRRGRGAPAARRTATSWPRTPPSSPR